MKNRNSLIAFFVSAVLGFVFFSSLSSASYDKGSFGSVVLSDNDAGEKDSEEVEKEEKT